ncbi:MAG TPA: hypothetical protein VJ961_09525 [Mariprofundaceae bacterium]|nr:hypothetical protein [Mariprofundaceae bacterium]
MDVERAREIVEALPELHDLLIQEEKGRLLVRHANGMSCFAREACFWPFVFRVADARDRMRVNDIEIRLAM